VGALCNDGRCLSVRLSVCPVPDPKSRTEGRSKLKIGRREEHDTGDPWPNLEVKRSTVKVTRPLNAPTENRPLSSGGKAYELQGAGHIVAATLQAAQPVFDKQSNGRRTAVES